MWNKRRKNKKEIFRLSMLCHCCHHIVVIHPPKKSHIHATTTITTATSSHIWIFNILFCFGRWQAPISIALHAPGTDFTPTINSIRYLRDCAPGSALVRQFTTFHIYFSSKHVPKSVSIPPIKTTENNNNKPNWNFSLCFFKKFRF